MAVGLVTTAIQIGTYLYDQYKKKQEEIVKSAEDITEAYRNSGKVYDENVQKLKDLEGEYDRLSKGIGIHGENIGLTASEYERYIGVIGEIVAISPSVVTGYDKEGNAMVRYRRAIKDAIKAQEDLKKAQEETYAGSGVTQFESIKTKASDTKKKIYDLISDVSSLTGEENQDVLKLLYQNRSGSHYTSDDYWNSIITSVAGDVI